MEGAISQVGAAAPTTKCMRLLANHLPLAETNPLSPEGNGKRKIEMLFCLSNTRGKKQMHRREAFTAFVKRGNFLQALLYQ
jgi:hypothetical protein